MWFSVCLCSGKASVHQSSQVKKAFSGWKADVSGTRKLLNQYLSTGWVQLGLKRRYPSNHKVFYISKRTKETKRKSPECKTYLPSFSYLGNPIISLFFLMFQVTCYFVFHIINNNYSYNSWEMWYFSNIYSHFLINLKYI